MPSEKSARVTVKKTRYHRPVKTAANTAVAAARRLMDAGDQEQAAVALRQAASTLDRAAKKKAIHKNNASRRKSRLAKGLQALGQP